MLRVLSRQAVKVVPRPRLGLRPPNGTPHRMHSLHPPHSGPPSYDTIARRLSSDIIPEAYFNRKRQEAYAHSEYGYLNFKYDIRVPDPKDFDVLISDVDDEKLRHEITEIVGIPYHSVAKKKEAKKEIEIGDCYLYGPSYRTIFPTVVAREGRAHWVFFIVNSGAPMTYLSAQASTRICGKKRPAN